MAERADNSSASAQAAPPATVAEPVVRRLGRVAYQRAWERMRRFTDLRDALANDEIWLLEHDPVFTQGLNCSATPAAPNTIPVVATDRGGQITYHGPGQLIVYPLIDLRRRRFGVRGLVRILEQCVIDTLAGMGVEGARVTGAPGVYVRGEKIAALGLRVRRGCTYHGLSLNVDVDLAPFSRIDPCGYPDLEVTRLVDLGVGQTVEQVQETLVARLIGLLPQDSAHLLNPL